jgi:MYXO-CTERM domain-containing protein
MSYCGSGDKVFSSSCDDLCPNCQGGTGSISCTATHEMFCGEGSYQQSEAQELTWLFGTSEPDNEAPTVEIVEPADMTELDVGGDVDLRAIVDDNYGGFGWKFVIDKDGEIIFDEPDYERDVDPEYRAALNLTNLEQGVYVLTVEAEDQYQNVGIDSVTILVGGAEPPSGTTGGDTDAGGDTDSDSGTTAGSSTGGSASDTDSGTGGDGAGATDPGDKGCSVGGRPSGGPLAFLLLALGALRRRKAGE